MIQKESLSNLLVRKYYQNLSFKNILKTAGKNYDEIEIRDFILSIKYQEAKERIIEQAKEYYAEIYECDKDEVCYGDFIEARKDCSVFDGSFPYAVVIGEVEISHEFKDAKKLKYVSENLAATGISDFSNLKYVGTSCDLEGTYQKVEATTMHMRRKTIKIPNLETCKHLYLRDCVVDSVNVKDLWNLSLIDAKIKNLNTRNIYQKLTLFGQIENADKLEFVDVLDANTEDENGFKYLYEHAIINRIQNNSSFNDDTTDIETGVELAKYRSKKRKEEIVSTIEDED